MARPLTRAQVLQNRAFLRALEQTGNAGAAARIAEVAISTIRLRRSAHPSFARDWDATLAVAHARLSGRWGLLPQASPAPSSAGALRTVGGEPVVQRGKNGRLQLRAALPARLTRAAEQAFLLALSATANVRLAAAAAGASFTLFYRRKAENPGFAREWRLALQEGYERLEAALLESAMPEAFVDDAWTRNERPEMPPMATAQALQLLYLHQKEARLLAEPAHLKRRRGESREAHSYRMAAMHRAGLDRDREAYRVLQAAKLAGAGPSPHETPIVLPDLAQVRASMADPAKGGHSDRALFGGWRIEHLTDVHREAAAAARSKQRPAKN